MIAQLWAYRHFIVSAIRNEYTVRFIRSRAGGLWMILHPLAQVAVYAIVLSNVLGTRLPGMDDRFAYAVYLMAGQLAWTTFADVIQRSLTLFIDNANLLAKVSFPRLILPLISSGIVGLNSMIFFAVILAIFAVLGHVPGWHALLVPGLIAITLLLGQAIGLICGLLNVFMRDVGQIVPIVLQFGFWLTPVVYRPDVLPAFIKDWLALNPMVHLVTAFHDTLVFARMPDPGPIAVVAAIAVLLMALALLMFRRASPELVEAL